MPQLISLLGSNIHHHRTGFIPVGMRYQSRPLLNLAFSRSEPSVTSCVLPVCALNGSILSLGFWHNVYVSYIGFVCPCHKFMSRRYQFAILLAGCRTIMRPGAMWFIKDPSDQNFHPIRDILERPALVQLRKLSVSAIMYGLVVACGVGSIGSLMHLGRSIVLPLRWKPR